MKYRCFILSRRIFCLVYIIAIFFHCSSPPEKFTTVYEDGVPGISGQIIDAKTDTPLPARVVVTNRDGEASGSYYSIYPGLFTEEDGSFSLDLQPGSYTVKITRGIDYQSQTSEVIIEPEKRLVVKAALEEWIPLKEMGWANGDGHAHLYTDKRRDDNMLAIVRKICRAQGVDFISTNQGWGGYDDDNWREGYERFSDDHFLLHYGAEMPKYRTGHTWWLNLKSCRHYFQAAMDTVYENLYYQSEKNPQWDFSWLAFPNIPDVELVPRFKKAENAVALIAHPTSWWWQKRGDLEKYTTNVCEYLSFSLLSGGLWDGLVVMGYDRDHYFYQNLWFHVLNEGYRVTPVAELDGGYGENNKFPYGTMRVYYHVGDGVTMEKVAAAVKDGRTFVTSGPIVFCDIDGKYQVGDVVQADKESHVLGISAFASGETEDYLSYVIVFRNGAIHKLWDVRAEKPRSVEKRLEIREEKRAWYAVKVYGRDAWQNPENLDVMSVCEQIQKGTFACAVEKENSICITGPFYFRPPGTGDPPVLHSNVKLRLVDPETKRPLNQASVQVLLNGHVIDGFNPEGGVIEFTMPVNAMLQIFAPEYPTIRRGLYLDYPPHRRIIETFASGRWLEEQNWGENLGPGQVPWQAFQFEKTREVLSDVEWTIEMRKNERDDSWEDFEALFE